MPAASTRTIVVPVDYATVQQAINHADNGDTIFVRSGIYHENLMIDKSIALVGQDPSNTILNGGNLGPAVKIIAGEATITGFSIQNPYGSFYALDIENCDHNVISGNVFHGGFCGVFLFTSNNNLISENSFSHVYDYGVLLGGYCSNNIIRDNIVKNTWYGIGLWHSCKNIVYNNMIESTGRGFHLKPSFEPSGVLLYENSTDNVITRNVLSDNGWNGVGVALFSNGNVFSDNAISGSTYYGIWTGENSSGNTFYHNSFDNQRQIFIQSGSNAWDLSASGNFWSDYNGTDANEDGIGDAPYMVNLENMDRYPLMTPWASVLIGGDLNHDSAVDIIDVVIAASSYDSTEGQPRWNAEADLAPPYGVINMIDLVTLCFNYGKKGLTLIGSQGCG